MNPIIQIEPWIDNSELVQLKKVIKSTFVSEHKLNQEFEDKIKKITGSKYAVSMTNGTAATFCALKALGIGKGDEVIVPNMTFIASSNAVIFAGATPVLCDIEEDTMCMCPKDLAKRITSKTKAIMPVHLYGRSCNMTELRKIAAAKKIKIIEDAAQGMGVLYRGQHVGTFGHAGILSFYANKTITCGEGGVVLAPNKKVIEDCYKMKNHGRAKKGVFVHESIGFNFSFTEMQAAVGVSQLNKLKRVIAKKQKIYNFYKKHIDNEYLIDIPINKDTTPVHWFSSYYTDHKKSFIKHMKNHNIQTREFFYPLNLQPCYKKSNLIKIKDDMPVSKKVFDRGISLPSAYNISTNQLKYVCDTINKFKP